MIRFEGLTKIYRLRGHAKVLFSDVDLVIPPKVSVALLGRNGAGKSTLLSMIAGSVPPTRGRIVSEGEISWPVGFSGSFHPELTGAQNARFIARVYGVETDALVAFVNEFAELGSHFHLPFRTYSSGMRSRLAFGVSMAVPFETYLVDEVTSVGDAAFKAKSRDVFLDRMSHAGAIVVSHSMNQLRELCTAGIVLEGGRMSYFDDLDEAIEQHEANMAAGGRRPASAEDGAEPEEESGNPPNPPLS